MATHTHDGIDWADRLAALRMADALHAEALTTAARRLADLLPESPTVVDIGCGAGGMSVLFARELAGRSGGTLVLTDLTPELLSEAEQAVTAVGVECQAVLSDLADPALPDRLPAADLVWASGVVHHVADQQAALGTLATLTRPGGWLAISEGGIAPHSLPWDLGVGRPGLEQRLLAAREEWFVGMRAGIPGAVSMPYGWPDALRRAGLSDVMSFSVLLDHPAPGTPQLREYVVHGMRRIADWAGDHLAADDRAALDVLLDPDSPEYLGAREDLYLLGTKTIHCGRRV
ncbi:class I SAM-dependent methyltransferase [Amycolatopsis sp. NPDC059021]|uniref:class I SAM-dependent methyltransferase n=1 Tax=Amycolatopsis sp. NPDC059021 TaxID=3346704 RepID=UPI0036705918